MRLYRCLLISALALAWPPALNRAAQLETWKPSIFEATHTGKETVEKRSISNGNRVASNAEAVAPHALDRAGPKRVSHFSKAYTDAFSILKENNPCSQFFGGPIATVALDRLVERLQPESLPGTHVGVQMSGAVTEVTDAPTGFSYRLFENAKVNSNGPFFKRKRDPSEDFVPNVGSFAPNTREARVSILLHELAHLVKAPASKSPLIPDDGDSPEQSAKNTETIEKICGAQIRTLKSR
jgi:hypothetical protein